MLAILLVIVLVIGVAGVIVVSAVGIVIGVFSKKAQARYTRGVEVAATIVLKGVVVAMGAGILYIIALVVFSK